MRITVTAGEDSKAMLGQPLKPFVVQEQPLGLKPGLSYEDIEELLDQVEERR